MSKPIDYDAPRQPVVEVDDDGLTQLTARGVAAQSPGADLDETPAAEGFELPGGDIADEELTVVVVPMRADEFRCTRCFLVHHRSRLAIRTDGQPVCPDCA